MKKTLLFLFILFTVASSAQDYKKEWAVVLEKEADGEIKQAAALTDIIYTKAQRKKNQPQVLKAFFFKAKYMQVIEEDAQFKIISNIQADITKTPFPAKAILKSLYAQMLEKIYSKNRYSIGQISNTSNYDKYNYRKWSSQNFVTEIEKAYKESLEPADLLYKTPLTVFEEIIDLSPSLRETKRPLYDFLAEQYLNYLCGSTTINYDYYKKNLPMLFGTTEQFLQLKTNDSLTHALGNTLTLLCELENHYLKEQDIQNLSIATLRRLERLDRNIYLNEKNSIYLATVKDLYSKSSKTAASYPVRFTQAQLLIRMADKKLYNSNINEALAICNELITTREKHDLGADAANLKTNYLRKEATIKFDDLIKPNTPSLAHVNYKNLDSVTIAFYKIPYNANTRDTIVRNTYIKSKIPVLKKAYVLPVKKDHFEYNTEIILPPLAKGTYAVVILPTEEAKPDKSSLVEKINVSQIAMVEQKDNNQAFYDIVDRFSGKPIDKAKAIVKNFPEQASDKNGKLIYNIPKGYVKNYNDPERIMVTWQGDTISKECNFNYNRYEPKDFIAKVEIYTDRSIYRPGQTVYFKAIAYKDYKGAFSVIPNTYFSIYVENESGEDIKKFRLKTNEYGSFADSVQLPKNMVGRFELHVEEDEDFEEDSLWNEKSFRGTDIAFNVEEYKRPTFEVTFNKIKNKIKLNETIKVNGSARAFSDATISNAKVEYQVTRKSKRYWYDNDYRSSEEITFGDTITDTNGQFAIEFNTIPDEDFDPKDLPVFIYDIKATITDINGETHSSLYTVYAGYHAVNITANLPKEINAADKAVIKLETNNLNGEFVPASGEVNIYKVYAPDRIYADRPFKEPEI